MSITRSFMSTIFTVQFFNKQTGELDSKNIKSARRFRTQDSITKFLRKKIEEEGNVFITLLQKDKVVEKYSIDEETFIANATLIETR